MKFVTLAHVLVIFLLTVLRRQNAYMDIVSVFALKWQFTNADAPVGDSENNLIPVKSKEVDWTSPDITRLPSVSVPNPGTQDIHRVSECEDVDACGDRHGFEAVRSLHRQLDDDANGNIDVAESDEFLRDELQYENGYERHKEFHGNDKHISVDELWQAWKASEVHNWTVEETIEWLVSYVDLPQYVQNFKEKNVDGSALPRLAVNANNYMSVRLGIKDPIHKQKIALKAMDVVLFGAPKHHNYLKDVLLVMSLVIAIGGCWFAYVQHKYSQTHLHKMIRDMESLQHAEEALLALQRELDKARQEQEIVATEKLNLERRLQDEITIAKMQVQDCGSSEIGDSARILELEEQLRLTREDLQRTEKMLESRPWAAPPALQHWLQLTHELEIRHYNSKRATAESQLISAKEGCEKLSKKRSTFMGAFRIAHGSSIDDVDDRILEAKAALCEVTKDLQERLHRWRQIEMLCGFSVVHNPGLLYLESVLKGASVNGSAPLHYSSGQPTLTRSSSEGTLLHDDSPPPYAAGISAGALANVPPPSYSSETHKDIKERHSSGSYSEKSSTHELKSSTLDWCHTDQMHHSLEPATEEEEEYEVEEDSTGRSATPPSCSSSSFGGASDSVKANFSVGDGLSESAGMKYSSSTSQIKTESGEHQAASQDMQISLNKSPSKSSIDIHSSQDSSKQKSNSVDKRKKGVGLVAAFRNSLGTTPTTNNNNTIINETWTQSNPCLDEHKKKKSFLNLKKRKIKM